MARGKARSRFEGRFGKLGWKKKEIVMGNFFDLLQFEEEAAHLLTQSICCLVFEEVEGGNKTEKGGYPPRVKCTIFLSLG
jgi:hypothetical protein